MGQELGQLVPVGGGDPIPLQSDTITIGRRATCDIRLDFSNVSGMHCELSFKQGIWNVRDLGSSNGIKINGERTMSGILRPGAELGIAGHLFTIEYQVSSTQHLDEAEGEAENVFGQSLMEKAGIVKPRPKRN